MRIVRQLIAAFDWWNQEKTSGFGKEGSFFSSRQWISLTFVIAETKMDKLKLKLLSHAPHSPDLFHLDYFLFSKLAGRFANNEEVEVGGYFEELDDSHYKQGIEARA